MSNPTTTDFNIIIQSNSDLFSIIVTDIYGRKAFEKRRMLHRNIHSVKTSHQVRT